VGIPTSQSEHPTGEGPPKYKMYPGAPDHVDCKGARTIFVKNSRLSHLLNINRGIDVKPLWEASLGHALAEVLKPEDFVDIERTVQIENEIF